METKIYPDPLQCNMKLSGRNRAALIARLNAVGRVDYTSFARELLETRLLNTPAPTGESGTAPIAKEFPEPLQCNLKLSGALRDALIQRLTEAGRTDHTTFVRETLEGILGGTGEEPEPKSNHSSGPTEVAPSDEGGVAAFIKSANAKINSSMEAALAKISDAEADLRRKIEAELQENAPTGEPVDSAAILTKAQVALDEILEQAKSRFALLEQEVRTAAQTKEDSTDSALNMAERVTTLENNVRDACTTIQEDAQRVISEVTRKFSDLESTVNEAVRDLHQTKDRSEEISAFLGTAKTTLDGVLTESVEKVLKLDSELRSQLGALNGLKSEVQKEIAQTRKLMAELASRPESQGSALADIKRSQEEIEKKVSEIDFANSKLNEDFAAYRARVAAQPAPQPRPGRLPLMLAALSLVGVAVLGVASLRKTPQPPAPNVANLEAAIAALTSRIDRDELTFAEELSTIQRELKVLKGAPIGQPKPGTAPQKP